MPAPIDMTGKRYGRLAVLEFSRKSSSGEYTWRCVCDCGNETYVSGYALRSGHTQSCGCLHSERTAEVRRSEKTHGLADTPEYRSWISMVQRVTNAASHNYPYYGGRGILICDRWLNGDERRSGVECFLADMGKRPAGTSLDRINNDGNYEPGNCRWATRSEQVRNRRPNLKSNNKETVHV